MDSFCIVRTVGFRKKPLCKKDPNPMLGQMEKRDQTKGTHKTTIRTLDSFGLDYNELELMATQPHMYLFVEVCYDAMHC